MKKLIVTKNKQTKNRAICARESKDCKPSTLKESLQIFHNIGSTRYKILETDLLLEKIIMIYQSLEKMSVPYYMLHGKRLMFKLHIERESMHM